MFKGPAIEMPLSQENEMPFKEMPIDENKVLEKGIIDKNKLKQRKNRELDDLDDSQIINTRLRSDWQSLFNQGDSRFCYTRYISVRRGRGGRRPG